MKYVLDVQYNGNESAIVACLGFENWEDAEATYVKKHLITDVMPYVSGKFFERELPCLLEALKGLDDIELVVVDGYVWLDEPTHKGLGLYLYDALEKRVPIIGVAKAKFGETPKECELLRGESSKPLYITTVDFDLEKAKNLLLPCMGSIVFLLC